MLMNVVHVSASWGHKAFDLDDHGQKPTPLDIRFSHGNLLLIFYAPFRILCCFCLPFHVCLLLFPHFTFFSLLFRTDPPSLLLLLLLLHRHHISFSTPFIISCASSMAVLPSSSSTLELTICIPGFASSPTLLPSSSSVKELDINQVPLEEDWMASNMEDEEESSNGDTPRKKLRLTKEQSRLLEESFRQNHTLNPKQKESLAMQLKLRPRQVEVWFQNRRARSKLKQTEMECEYLKRWFGSLTEQNRRLQREVEELRAMKVGPPTVISPHSSEPLPASTLTMCPRCERVTTTADKPPSVAVTLSAKVPAQSRQPSAAC
ncbi:unnamed protein product [Sphenostylis stenocarpa]|uniref:Homeobox domain-containing protein n=1 Tax=Sphenostylis stenocarpa TaxID=92480 RepID=A0AA86S2I6_9FABA|nr:unnamed protein product [Sphenostylis stenocarpa]